MLEGLRVIEMACAGGGWLSVQGLEPNFYEIFLESLGLQQDPEFQRQFDQEAWPGLSARGCRERSAHCRTRHLD